MLTTRRCTSRKLSRCPAQFTHASFTLTPNRSTTHLEDVDKGGIGGLLAPAIARTRNNRIMVSFNTTLPCDCRAILAEMTRFCFGAQGRDCWCWFICVGEVLNCLELMERETEPSMLCVCLTFLDWFRLWFYTKLLGFRVAC